MATVGISPVRRGVGAVEGGGLAALGDEVALGPQDVRQILGVHKELPLFYYDI